MHSSITGSPFQHSAQSVAHLMQLLLYALVPGIVLSFYFFGFGILINISLACIIALAAEAAILRLRNMNIRAHLEDRSAIVTAILFAIAIPPGSPWWLVATGILFSIVVAKHLYGGLGQNPFNPAMCGYVLLLLAFPLEMTNWHIPNEIVNAPLTVNNLGIADAGSQQQIISPLSWTGFKQSLMLSFPFAVSGVENGQNFVDALAMATPLIEFKMAGQSAILTARESASVLFSRESGTGWELINICYLFGGLFLLFKRIISWHIPVSIIASILVLSTLFYSPGSSAIYGTPYLHLFGSATMLGAFFIATDPVSAATSGRGKIYYGIIIGIAIYSIRVWGSYLDSIALAVLFGNFCTPLLDHLCRPRIYGQGKLKNPWQEKA